MQIIDYDVKVLSAIDLKLINGGSPTWKVVARKLGMIGLVFSIVDSIVYVVDNWDKVEEGVADGADAADSFADKYFDF